MAPRERSSRPPVVLAFVRLRTFDKLAVARAGVAAAVVEVGLQLWSLATLARRLGVSLRVEDRTPSRPSAATAIVFGAREQRRIRAVDRVMRHWPFGDTCLRRALVLGHLLRRRHPELLVGVRRSGDDVHAHAWIEFAGVALGESVDHEYRVLRRAATLD